jgi:hypothetical protein
VQNISSVDIVSMQNISSVDIVPVQIISSVEHETYAPESFLMQILEAEQN